MTLQQWNDHINHFRADITWPADKETIVKACDGKDLAPGILDDIKANLTDGKIYQNEEEVKEILVKE